ncbi:SHOCT domain-containing protein [Nocardiopsis sp. NPDC007018]|uniref:SHOCT domain-containing protein n=1 Tax=Nocardiopsis sp. NPDC007018 TaxID=3155721 RepID=UPI0033C93F8A
MNVFVAVVAIVVLAGLGFFLVLTVTETGRLLRRRHEPPVVEPGDAATQELRLRYARGEISREEYLQRRIDLEEF